MFREKQEPKETGDMTIREEGFQKRMWFPKSNATDKSRVVSSEKKPL